MPCYNLTESINLTLDRHDGIIGYKLIKTSCGAAVGGESLLLDFFRGRPFADILRLDAESFCRTYPASDNRWQFLYLKHFIALNALLRVYTGAEPGGVEDFCAISGINSDNGTVTIDAQIAVDPATNEIKACGHCDGCKNKAAARRRNRKKA